MRIVLLGDVMLGRRVGEVVRSDPGSVFEQLRPVLVASDLVLANLESPLTGREHAVGPYALEADPSAARLLVGAGIDVVSIANNHAGDAGPLTVSDTLDALGPVGLEAAGVATVGVGVAPLLVELDGVRIAVLAFDLTGGGPAPTDGHPGVARWDVDAAEAAVAAARAAADVVIVGIHGGVEYLSRPDPVLRRVVDLLTDWGVDIVWGHGTHVPYPVAAVRSADARTTVQAPGLGNALFDQGIDGTDEGAVLEVAVDVDGVVAHRTGRVAGHLRTAFVEWELPASDAVALDGEWWTPARPIAPVAARPALAAALVPGAVVTASGRGDLDGDGAEDVVVSYRTPYRPRVLEAAFPGVDLVDADGRAAHLAVFDSAGRLRWGAGTMLQPVGALAVCDGAVAVVFAGLDEPGPVAGGAWSWKGFGFATAPELTGAARPGCADVDGDGRLDPVLVGRDSRSP